MSDKATWKNTLEDYQKEYRSFYEERKTGVNSHQEQYKRLMDKIMLIIYENEDIFFLQMKKSVKKGWLSEDDYRNVLLDVFVKFRNDYNPFDGRNIQGYLFDHCTWEVLSRVDKLAGVDRNKDSGLSKEEKRKIRGEKYEKTPIVSDDPYRANDTKQTTYKKLKNQTDLSDEILDNKEEQNGAFLELAAIVLNFTKNHNKKTGSPQRKLLFELFYSNDIINYCKDPYSPDSLQHEHVVMSAMHIPYCNFCTALPNQYNEINAISIKKIQAYPFKTVGEIAPSNANPLRPDEEAKAPLGNQPILGYLEKDGKYNIDDSGVSQQKKKYFEEVCPIFNGKVVLTKR